MKNISTACGSIPVNEKAEAISTEGLLSCVPAGRCRLETSAGSIVPLYNVSESSGRSVRPVYVYRNGEIHSVSLQERAAVETSAGVIEAERVTFHEDGSLERVFPLSSIDAFFDETKRHQSIEAVSIVTPAGTIRSRIISASFYESGALNKICLWPGESVEISTPLGIMGVKGSFGFLPDGSLEFMDPALPLNVETPAGSIPVYDDCGVTGSCGKGTIMFDEDGGISSVKTGLCGLHAVSENGQDFTFLPESSEQSSFAGRTSSLEIAFHPKAVAVKMSPVMPAVCLALKDFDFEILNSASDLKNYVEYSRAV